MLVMKNINLEENQDFLNYILKKCNIISLTKYHDQHSEQHSRIINIILTSGKYSKEDILNVELINNPNKIYDDFKDNEEIFNSDYKNKYENDSRYLYLIEDNRKSVIMGSIYEYFYNYVTNRFIDKFKDITIKKEEVLLTSGVHHSTIYYFKLNTDIKKELILKKSISKWQYPYSMEDISFYLDDYCYLRSISHEDICEIYYDNEEEFKYLKFMGIEFDNENYIPVSKDDSSYPNF